MDAVVERPTAADTAFVNMGSESGYESTDSAFVAEPVAFVDDVGSEATGRVSQGRGIAMRFDEDGRDPDELDPDGDGRDLLVDGRDALGREALGREALGREAPLVGQVGIQHPRRSGSGDSDNSTRWAPLDPLDPLDPLADEAQGPFYEEYEDFCSEYRLVSGAGSIRLRLPTTYYYS